LSTACCRRSRSFCRAAQLLAFDGEIKEPHGIGVFDLLKADADRLHRLARRGRLRSRRLRLAAAGACERDDGQQ
jgi:hypothetical protein